MEREHRKSPVDRVKSSLFFQAAKEQDKAEKWIADERVQETVKSAEIKIIVMGNKK